VDGVLELVVVGVLFGELLFVGMCRGNQNKEMEYGSGMSGGRGVCFGLFLGDSFVWVGG